MGDEPSTMKPTSAEQAVFAEVLQRDTPEARARCLDAACGTDAALRQRIEALLRAAENAGDFLEQPPTGVSSDADSTALVSEFHEKPGDRIGRYKLLEKSARAAAAPSIWPSRKSRCGAAWREMPGEGPRPPLRDGQRHRGGHSTAPRARTDHGAAAERDVSAAKAGATKPRGLDHTGRRSRGCQTRRPCAF